MSGKVRVGGLILIRTRVRKAGWSGADEEGDMAGDRHLDDLFDICLRGLTVGLSFVTLGA